jgi:hypothetical protein
MITPGLTAQQLFVEAVNDPNDKCSLFIEENPYSGEWREFAEMAAALNPLTAQLHQEQGIIGAEDSRGWRQLTEHATGVAAAAVTGRIALKRHGVEVDPKQVVDATINHEVTKKRDVLRRKQMNLAYGAENRSDVALPLKDVLLKAGFDEIVAVAASNTGREDRVFATPEERWQSIVGMGVLPNLVAISDGYMLDTHYATREEAQAHYLKLKGNDPPSREFFTGSWPTHFAMIEEDYLTTLGGNSLVWSREVTDQTIEQTVLDIMHSKDPEQALLA